MATLTRNVADLMTITPEKRVRLFWSAASGITLTCAFDTIGIGFLAWFALAMLLLSLRNATVKEALGLGLLAGLVHYGTLLYWLVPTMHQYGPLPVWVSIGALLLLAFYLAIYVALFSAAVTAVARRPVFLVLVVPVFWVSLEYMKTYFFSGFPWGLIGYSQYNYLHLIQVADIFGVYGVSFFVAMINAALFVIFLHAGGRLWQHRPATRSAAVFCIVLVAGMFAVNAGYGRYKLAEMDDIMAGADKLRVSVVQGNIEQSMKWDDDYIRSTVDRYLSLSDKAMAFEPQLVVWPETAMPFYFLQKAAYTDTVIEAIERMETWFLIGSPAFELDQKTDDVWFYNSAYLMDPKARKTGVYDKVHLVPFGEYVPFDDWLPFVNRMVDSIGDFKPGNAGTVLSSQDAALGVQICYEIIFPHLSAAMVQNGGNLLVNITNDAWFGKTAGPSQHFSMAVFRSVENRRALIRSANTGISGFVDPAGRIMGRTDLYETTHINRVVPVITSGHSFYTKYTDSLPAASIAASLLILAVSGIRRKRRKQGGPYDVR